MSAQDVRKELEHWDRAGLVDLICALQEGEAPEELPAEAAAARSRLQEGRRRRQALWSTVRALVCLAAAAVLAASALPVLRISGTSMAPALREGDVVAAARVGTPQTGDLIAFYYQNKVLVKRVAAQAGQWVDITADGTVLVDGQPLPEPYLPADQRALGSCDIDLPYQVPDGHWFVLGDSRETSIDSRSQTVGCVGEDQLLGRLLLRVWPLDRAGSLWGGG